MIGVLIVDDERITAEAHAAYVARISGYAVAAVAHTGAEALRLISASRRADMSSPAVQIDLVLLDMNLPDRSGLDVCRSIRAAGLAIDVIAITAVRELPVVRQAIAVGVVQYLIKPFTFAAFADKLENYAAYHAQVSDQGAPATQSDVDSALAALRRTSVSPLPKGLSVDTLGAVVTTLQAGDRTWSAGELSEHAGLSRVTARRYLEHLTALGQVHRESRYGGAGRPEIEYRWVR